MDNLVDPAFSNTTSLSDATAPRVPEPTSPRRVPPPRLYIYFDAIVRHGSIRKAAEALRIASSAMNRRLLDLEHDIGTPLFHRLPDGVRLTAAGEILAAHVRRTLADLEHAGARIEELYGAMRGQISIGAAESAAMDLLPAAMAAFQGDYSEIRFTVDVTTPGAMLAGLLDDRLDLILTHTEPDHHDAAVLAIAPRRFCAVMRRDHPLAAREKLFLRDCREVPVVLAQENFAARTLVEAVLAAEGARMRPALITNNFEMMKHYVRHGDSVALQFHLESPSSAATGLVAVPLADPPLAETRLLLVARRSRTLPAPAAAFAERLRKLLTETGAR